VEASKGGRRWFAGLLLGGGLTFVLLSWVLMPVGVILMLVLIRWSGSGDDRLAAAGGLLIGFGSVTLALFLLANARCSSPGTCYESSPALPLAALVILAGVAASAVVVRRS
jgi:hypothetical protein